MKTVEEIISYLETELADAYEMHDQAKWNDKQEALFYFLKATFIVQLLDEIKES